MYIQRLAGNLIIQNAEMRHAEAMADLQRRVFPTLSADELLTTDHFAEHIRVFPQGQFVILFNNTVIGSTSTFRTHFPNERHTFLEVTGNLWLSTHDPKGEWLYGFDLGIDPNYQGLGLGRFLYRARGELCQKLKMAGQVIVGMPSGYGKLKDKLPFEQYYGQILNNQVFDPTVSMQMKVGFEPCIVIPEYLEDPKCGNFGVMMMLPTNKVVDMPKLSVEKLEEKFAQVKADALENLNGKIVVESINDSSSATKSKSKISSSQTEKLLS